MRFQATEQMYDNLSDFLRNSNGSIVDTGNTLCTLYARPDTTGGHIILTRGKMLPDNQRFFTEEMTLREGLDIGKLNNLQFPFDMAIAALHKGKMLVWANTTISGVPPSNANIVALDGIRLILNRHHPLTIRFANAVRANRQAMRAALPDWHFTDFWPNIA